MYKSDLLAILSLKRVIKDLDPAMNEINVFWKLFLLIPLLKEPFQKPTLPHWKRV